MRRSTTDPARYVGRVGALAVALGIGAALVGMPGVAFADTSDSTTSQSSASDAAGTARPSVAHPRSARRTSVGNPESADAPNTGRRHSRTTPTKRADTGKSDTNGPASRRVNDATRADDPGTDGAGDTTARATRNLPQPTEAAVEPAATSPASASRTPKRLFTAGRATQETSPIPAEASAPDTTTVAVKVLTTLTTNRSTRPKPANPAQAALLSTLLAWTRRTSESTADPATGVTNTGAPIAAQAAATTPVTVGAGSTAGVQLPAVATVFTLRGMNVRGTSYDPMPKQYGSMFAKAPYTMVALNYSAAWNRTSITEGVQLLDAALASTPGDIIVMAHSEGAQVASRWMRTYANDPTRAALASRVTFLLSGNPLRSSQGGGGQMIGLWENDGTRALATPTTTPWPIIDVARRWDGWADWPDDTTNKVAVRNATIGMTLFHANYNNVNLYDPANTVWHNGNTTYVLTRENKPPLITSYFRADPNFVSVVRGQIEAAYHRPPNDIPVPVVPTTSTNYQKILVKLGIPNAAPSRSAVTA
ncbi:PE-PPE domain-containing protein [Mycolicibacterium chubuense]|uniref:PE-PPE domain-containing protein n=1 Tax=Mycolicibacterium chubuense TaxID=1800 RepID=UPI00069D2FF1|nr:PE-PPE domain-containing protein [Mycolicibacterium chubuense]ORA51923.1 PE-PPE domain-containing protein [Mycolicibacterium chubuense]